jgi:hypothetical protein
MESLYIKDRQINEYPACLNASLTISNYGGETIQINAVKLGQIAQSNSIGVAINVNGTGVDCATVPFFRIEPNDTAVVNMIVPYTSYPYALSTLHNAEYVTITVLTDNAMYYTEYSPSSK